jgi:small-conductance mechanosensitive channel
VVAVGINTGPLFALISPAGLVIGLALQGTVSNVASGILIFLDRPFGAGDLVYAGCKLGKAEVCTPLRSPPSLSTAG